MKIWAGCLVLALLAAPVLAAEPRKPGEYPPTADSLPQPGVPKGKLIGPLEFHSKIIAGTVRRYWIYVPAKYDPKTPPNLLVFQDGQRAINPQGPLNIPVVLDNLIAKGDIPPTLGIFITPGQHRHRALSRQSGHRQSQPPRARNMTRSTMPIPAC